MRSPAQALAEAVRSILEHPDPTTHLYALERALAAFDAWKPWEDGAVVMRAADAVYRLDGLDTRREAIEYAIAALKAALGGDA